jgi:hypothetical protein
VEAYRIKCFWALAESSRHAGEPLHAREYLEMYLVRITDLIEIDERRELPPDEAKLILKARAQESLDEVIAQIQAEIKAGEAIEDDTESSDEALYIKGKVKEKEKARGVDGGRKRRNALVEEEITLEQDAAERKAFLEHGIMPARAWQQRIRPKVPIDGWATRDRTPPLQYESWIIGDIEDAGDGKASAVAEDAAEEEDDVAYEADLDEGSMPPRSRTLD